MIALIYRAAMTAISVFMERGNRLGNPEQTRGLYEL